MQPKMKPAGKPVFVIGVDVGGKPEALVYDGGDLDGALIAFSSREEAQRFIDDNDAGDTHFVVDLTDVGAH